MIEGLLGLLSGVMLGMPLSVSNIPVGNWSISTIHKPGASWEQQMVIQYAWWVGGGDEDFVSTIECENGSRDPLKRSQVWYEGDDGEMRQEQSRGLCQWNRRWWSDILYDENFFNPYRQVEKCREQYQQRQERGIIHNRLYGYNRRNVCRQRFEVRRWR